MTFQEHHWYLKDLQYEYLDDGFKLTAYTDVPCHLFCRMTTTPPRKHALPSYRRGLFMQGDIRFCFVVYEDNEQDEAGDTLTHTFIKDKWPVCQHRWFYFIGTIGGLPSPSESPIFEFHFPAPPPEPPPPMERIFYATVNNRMIEYSHVAWPATHDNPTGAIHPWYSLPNATLWAGEWLTATYRARRCFLDFDTTVMSDTAKIVSATLYLYIQWWQRTSNILLTHLCITHGIQDLPPIPTNYGDQLPFTLIGGKRDFSTLTTGQYNNIDFNAAGLSWIYPTGITKLCLRGEQDVEDFQPPLGTNMARFHSTQKGGDYRPYLKVAYYPA